MPQQGIDIPGKEGSILQSQQGADVKRRRKQQHPAAPEQVRMLDGLAFRLFRRLHRFIPLPVDPIQPDAKVVDGNCS